MKIRFEIGKLFCIALSALLVCFYVCVLYRGMHPHTSRGYNLFYIEQKLINWPGKDGIKIQRGETMLFNERTSGKGQIAGHFYRSEFDYGEEYEWQYTEQGYCIVGWQADLIFETEPGESYHGRIVFQPEKSVGEVSVFVNDEYVGVCSFGEMQDSVEFEITPEMNVGNTIIVKFILGADAQTPLKVQEVTFW